MCRTRIGALVERMAAAADAAARWPLAATAAGPRAAPAPAGERQSAAAHRVAAVAWADASGPPRRARCCRCASPSAPGSATEVTVRVAGGTVAGLPDACAPSTVVRRRSYLSADGTTLVCDVVDERAQELAVEVRAGAAPGPLHGHGQRRRHRHRGPGAGGGGRAAGHPAPAAAALQPGLPERRRRRPAPGPGLLEPAPVRQLHQPGLRAGASTTSWTTGSAQQPDAVLVAGDLVDGRWGRDSHHTGNFGPVGNPAQRADGDPTRGGDVLPAVPPAVPRARPRPLPGRRRPRVRRQPLDRLEAPAGAGVPGAVRALLHPHPVRPTAVPRPPDRRARRHGVRLPPGAGRPGGHHRPVRHRPRPRPDPGRPPAAALAGGGAAQGPARRRAVDDRPGPRADPRAGPLARLQRAALPGRRALAAVAGSSRGTASTSTSAARCTTSPRPAQDGILQLAHGGAFQFGLTTYALLDVHDDRLDVTLRDYAVKVRDARDHSRLWETVRSGLKKWVTGRPRPGHDRDAHPRSERTGDRPDRHPVALRTLTVRDVEPVRSQRRPQGQDARGPGPQEQEGEGRPRGRPAAGEGARLRGRRRRGPKMHRRKAGGGGS